jgi:prolycopene isomerase
MSAYKDMLKKLFPASREGIDKLFVEMATVFHAANGNHNLVKNISALLPYIRGNYESMISKYVSDVKLKALISQLWIYFGLPPSMLRAVDFCYPWFDYTNNGGYYVEKGSYEIVKALVSYARKRGVSFLFNKNVGRIFCENGSNHRVAFGKDEVVCDTIISNIDLNKTVFELIGSRQFPSASIGKMRNMEPSISAFEIFLGLDVDLKKMYPDDYEIFVNSDYDIDRQYHSCLNNNAKMAPFVITMNSNVNRFSAPSGNSVVNVIMLAGYKYWVSKSRGEYQDKKDKIADILIERASKVIPEVKGHVKKIVVSTPVTFERYTNNSCGAIYGYARTTDGGPEIRANEITKNIKNLYFASSWARQGSGVVKVLRSAEDVYGRISKSIYQDAAA